MIRGTTAQFKFILPYTKAELTWAQIHFWQPNNPSKDLPITKYLYDCGNPADSNELCVSLTAEETKRFLDKYKAKVQIRALHTASGTIFGCPVQLITVYPIHDSMLTEDIPTVPNDGDTPEIIHEDGV